MTPALSADNKLIQCFWTGPLTTMELLSVSSFLANGHEVEVYCYDRDRGHLLERLPGEVYLRDAEEVVPPADARTFRCAQHLSDTFRIKLLLAKGGWYSDLDNVLLKSLDHSTPHVFYRDHDESTISLALSKAPAGSPFLAHCSTYIDSLTAEDRTHLGWQEIGSELVLGALEYFKLTGFAQPGRAFDPVQWQRVRDLVDPTVEWDLTDSYSIHLFHAAWNSGPEDRTGRGFDLGQPLTHLDTDALYHPDCLYEKLKAKYL